MIHKNLFHEWNFLYDEGKVLLAALSMYLCAALLALLLALFSQLLSVAEAFRITLGITTILILPGYALTYCFFPTQKQEGIDWLERSALSIALSIAVVPLLLFYLNLIGVPITALSSVCTSLGITLAALIIVRTRRNYTLRHHKS